MRTAIQLLRTAIGLPLVLIALSFVLVGCAIGGPIVTEATAKAFRKHARDF